MRKPNFCPDALIQWSDPNPDEDPGGAEGSDTSPDESPLPRCINPDGGRHFGIRPSSDCQGACSTLFALLRSYYASDE